MPIHESPILAGNTETIVLYTTGFGVVKGGSDLWTNKFLKYIVPKLKERANVMLLVDGIYNSSHKDTYDKYNISYAFLQQNKEYAEELLATADKIFVLNQHLHSKTILNKYRKRIHTVFCHLYIKDVRNWSISSGGQDYIPYSYSMDAQQDILKHAQNIVWVGTARNTWLIQDYPDTHIIPNFYSFQNNIDVSTFNISSLPYNVGYAARLEGRKCPHYLDGHIAYAFTEYDKIGILQKNTGLQFEDVTWVNFDYDWHDYFFTKEPWMIFHGAYKYEPFGYSIFQALDYRKIPILDESWILGDLDYEYVCNDKSSFDKCVRTIQNAGPNKNKEQLRKLMERLKKFDYREQWTKAVLEVLDKPNMEPPTQEGEDSTNGVEA